MDCKGWRAAAPVLALVWLAGCETPERRAVLDRMDKLQAENSVLKASTGTSVAQGKIEIERQRQNDQVVIENLTARIDELSRQIQALSQGRPAETKPDPKLEAELERQKAERAREKAETQAKLAKMQEELAKAQAQAEAAKLAAEAVDKRPKEGQAEGDWRGRKLPLAKFVDASGKLVDLNTFTGKQPVVLVFMKGFYSQGVCFYCTKQTSDLGRNAAKFKELNAEVLVAYPGGEENINTFVRSVKEYEKSDDPRFQIPFKVLLDVNQDAVKVLGIAGDLAHPSSYIIDKDGVVRFQKVGRTMSDRPSVDELLNELKKLGGAKP